MLLDSFNRAPLSFILRMGAGLGKDAGFVSLLLAYLQLPPLLQLMKRSQFYVRAS